MRSKGMGLLCGFAALSLVLSHVEAQPQTAPPPDTGLKVGPASIPRHWSRYRYPETIPDGATYCWLNGPALVFVLHSDGGLT